LKNIKWKAYNKLAWIDLILTSPDECIDETNLYVKTIKDFSKIDPETMLHLGCGAGLHDYTLKKHFKITGVDLSKGMLKIAQNLNPEVNYLNGDMRTIRVPDIYDTIIIPDSIGYMVTIEDLKKTIHNSYKHLKQGGVFLIVAHTREEFKENNFVYTGSKENINITVFENNHITDSSKEKYEAVITYLIRRAGKLEIVNECHTLGLFPLKTWLTLLEGIGFEVKQKNLNNLYDSYIMNGGEYSQTIFVCIK
jgi:SAM-dependent methyltransferase